MIFRAIRNVIALCLMVKAAIEWSYDHYEAATFYLLVVTFMVIVYRDDEAR